jgi:hypothetical protein
MVNIPLSCMGIVLPTGRPFESAEHYKYSTSSTGIDKPLEYGTFRTVKLFDTSIVKES